MPQFPILSWINRCSIYQAGFFLQIIFDISEAFASYTWGWAFICFCHHYFLHQYFSCMINIREIWGLFFGSLTDKVYDGDYLSSGSSSLTYLPFVYKRCRLLTTIRHTVDFIFSVPHLSNHSQVFVIFCEIFFGGNCGVYRPMVHEIEKWGKYAKIHFHHIEGSFLSQLSLRATLKTTTVFTTI